jgi:hypothetical protein
MRWRASSPVSTAHICEVFPTADRFGFLEMSAFGLHRTRPGLALHERPIIQRRVAGPSDRNHEGMVRLRSRPIALRPTVIPPPVPRRRSSLPTRVPVISLFPAEELPIANAY